MPLTPFFPPWRSQLAAWGSRLAQPLKVFRVDTLAQLEERFAHCLPEALFPKADKALNSRDRIYTQRRTFWCFLWQCLNPQTPCREVVRQVQALFKLHDGPHVSEEDGAYCRARQRLPRAPLSKALLATAQAADRHAPPMDFLRGRPVKIVDGSSLTLPDTLANRAAYPKISTLKEHCGFPMMRLVVVFSLLSGAILNMVCGNLYTSELPLFHQLMPQLTRGDIVVGDRGFGNYVIVCLLQGLGIDFVGRSARHIDGRRRQQRLGRNDWLVRWHPSGNRSAFLSPAAWAALPKELTVRIVRGSLYQPGFRVRQVTLVTTLLDDTLYPAEQILRAYLRRWRLEMCLDDLKTTLGMEMLRCLSPAMVEKEAVLYLIAHNLIRIVMAQAALAYEVPIQRLSFKGCLDAVRQFNHAMCQARTKRKRHQLWEELLRTVAADQVPDRPDRREPRAIKRKKNRYPNLNAPRHKFRDHLKRHARRTKSRLRKLMLK